MPTVRTQMDKQGWHDSLGMQDGNIASEQRIATVGLPLLRIAGQTGRHQPIPVSAIKPRRWLFQSRAVCSRLKTHKGGFVLWRLP
jgi:hypothetical protein